MHFAKYPNRNHFCNIQSSEYSTNSNRKSRNQIICCSSKMRRYNRENLIECGENLFTTTNTQIAIVAAAGTKMWAKGVNQLGSRLSNLSATQHILLACKINFSEICANRNWFFGQTTGHPCQQQAGCCGMGKGGEKQ